MPTIHNVMRVCLRHHQPVAGLCVVVHWEGGSSSHLTELQSHGRVVDQRGAEKIMLKLARQGRAELRENNCRRLGRVALAKGVCGLWRVGLLREHGSREEPNTLEVPETWQRDGTGGRQGSWNARKTRGKKVATQSTTRQKRIMVMLYSGGLQ
ncbi:uncharacterized protein K460DRAFT_394309 [Cucurbitaria berberidis CBS 394.84]|uniref:Uncharacterized protein n=1 Tax=Cucurbitaria berberidis CBS 394.84 TaxID=1168544 RepID=A0A9P4GQJ3_9PLEO|nr:uncharacterized protein K460DRAFT_394309 [Cucurbitaria berberidis CBS 394.84]KAF1849489.1 hypothetical protein K460DRAFT_394309 [Cucurbitaria berberidis CBS 394.84]